jgi:hypothetical protein
VWQCVSANKKTGKVDMCSQDLTRNCSSSPVIFDVSDRLSMVIVLLTFWNVTSKIHWHLKIPNNENKIKGCSNNVSLTKVFHVGLVWMTLSNFDPTLKTKTGNFSHFCR